MGLNPTPLGIYILLKAIPMEVAPRSPGEVLTGFSPPFLGGLFSFPSPGPQKSFPSQLLSETGLSHFQRGALDSKPILQAQPRSLRLGIIYIDQKMVWDSHTIFKWIEKEKHNSTFHDSATFYWLKGYTFYQGRNKIRWLGLRQVTTSLLSGAINWVAFDLSNWRNEKETVLSVDLSG